jgi:L-amino acid N-acyltransferase YncA
MTSTIRFAQPADAAAIQAVYAPYCESTTVSFEVVAPTVEQMADRIAKISSQYPWLVCEVDGDLVGYVYASQHRERAAYRWGVDAAIYLAKQFHRRGIGRALYTSLFAMLREQGYVRAYAGITLPNPSSVGVHEAMGFTPVAHFPAEGFKSGKWHDVGWWQLELRSLPDTPPEPRPIAAIRDKQAVADAIAAGERLLADRAHG